MAKAPKICFDRRRQHRRGPGIEVKGNRHWTGNAGAWDVAITGVQMRPQDPVPQAGSFTDG
jgi:hypothetical protein